MRPPLFLAACVALGGMIAVAGVGCSDTRGPESQSWRGAAVVAADQPRLRFIGGAPRAEGQVLPPSDEGPFLTTASERPLTPCSPTAGGPYWIEENETIAVKISCASGQPVSRFNIEHSGLPPGADFDEGENTLRWTTHLDDAGNYEVMLRVAGGRDTGVLKINVADRFDDKDNVAVDPMVYQEEAGLPVFHLTIPPGINGETQSSARLIYKGRSHAIEAKYRGKSSLYYPKKSFTLKFGKSDLFSDPAMAGGFLNKRRVVLISTFDDNSYVRQRLSFEVWNRMGTIRVQTSSAVVFVNGTYRGVYTVADSVDEDLMRAAGLPQGNLYKSVDHGGNFSTPDSVRDSFEKKNDDGDQAEAFADISELTDFIANANDETFREKIGERLDMRDYVGWLISVTAIHASDSLGKNAYHYHHPDTGLWKVAPWDFNASFGQAWNTARETPDPDPVEVARQWNRLFARFFDDEVLGRRTRDRYAEALENQISVEVVSGIVDRIVIEVDMAARRDQRRWRTEYLGFERWSGRTDFTDYDDELAYLRRWIKDRWAFLRERM